MSAKITFIYLHGFASSPLSSKAKYFAEHLQAENARVQIPDLNGSDFEALTLSSQLQILDNEFDRLTQDDSSDLDNKVVLVGSSMGGLLSVLQSKRRSNVVALILMAPGFGLMKRWPDLFGANTLDDWKQQGFLNIYHHGVGDYRRLSYQFIEDASKYQTDDFEIGVPTIVFHGRNDATVPVSESEAFHQRNMTLAEFHSLNDDHQLLASLDYIWQHSRSFLQRHQLL